MRRLLLLAAAGVVLSSPGAEAAFSRCVGERCVYVRDGGGVCIVQDSPKGYSKICVP